jgi:1-phosphatidylinositol phosphodiesterase
MLRGARLNVTGGSSGILLRLRFAVILAMWLPAAAVPLLVSWTAPVASAHDSSGYSHDSTNGATHTGWMANIPDELRLSELSIPGTHDTGAYEFGGDIALAQSMNVSNQLNAGIRAMDIRLKIDDGELMVYHGIAPQGLDFDADVLDTVTSFLAAHPSETVLMRIKDEDAPPATDGFDELVIQTLNSYSSYVYQGSSDNPTLGEVRGKIVVLQNFSSSFDIGIPWSSLSIQDEFDLDTNWDLAWKWGQVKDHFATANNNVNYLTIHVNFTSAANGGFPYFFASGHSSPQTGAPRLLTGYTRGVIDTCADYPDKCIDEFPSVNCFAGTCSVAFEGINILAMDYLNAGNVRRAGIVMSDFPGHGLVEAIINLNPWNWPPVADAGGAYTGDEGSAISFSAAGSSDQDGDALSYRWDFDNDAVWDTASSSNSTASHTWPDDYTGPVVVEVSDGYHASTATALVTVLNVPPTIQSVTNSGPVIHGSATTVTVLASDPAGAFDPLSYAFDCDDDGVFEVGPQPEAGAMCSFGIREGAFEVNVRVDDGDGGEAFGTTTVVVPTFMCANGKTGSLRYSDTDMCSSREMLIILADSGSVNLCVSLNTGRLRHNRNGTCTQTEWAIRLPDNGPLAICVSHYTSVIRAARGQLACGDFEFRREIGN